MPLCVTQVTVYGFATNAAGTGAGNRATYTNVLQAQPSLNTGSASCSYVALTKAEFLEMQPLPRLTASEISALASAVVFCWATAWTLRFVRRQIPR